MKKKNFVTLILSTIGGILSALGMCMALLPEWNAFRQGVVLGCVGLSVLLAMVITRRKMEGKTVFIKLTGKTVAAILLGIVGTLTFGSGMCMTMVFANLMIPGIVVGLVGILMLMGLIPVCRGIQ